MAGTKSRRFTYYALSFTQRKAKTAPKFIIFHAPAAEIIEWADVDRLAPENEKGAQRPLRQLKVKKVARFLESDVRNTIPTSVVVALDSSQVSFKGSDDKDGAGQHGTITITMKANAKPGLIIDGQHRAFGMALHTGTVHLNVVAFLGGDDAERAFQFVVINNSATRVSKDHIRALNLSYDKDVLNERLLKSAGVSLGLRDVKYEDFQLVDSSAPFKGLLEWPTNPEGFVAPNAIEAALAETRDRGALLGIEDLERDFFLAIWVRIKHLFGSAWHQDTPQNRSHLLQKVSISAMTVYVLDSLEAAQRMNEKPLDFTEEDTLHRYLDRVVSRIPIEFWTTEWRSKELDTSGGRQLLLDSLKMIDSNVRFDRPWYDKVALIDPADLADNYEPRRGSAPKTAKKGLRRKKR
jgi:DGQHR domain-containing protein